MEKNFENIYYSKEYQIAIRNPTKRFLFLQWILDFVCLTEALINNYDRWYQQLFYIKLAELFKAKYEDIFEDQGEDRYILKVSTCLKKIYNVLSDDECIYILYRRDSAAHPFQDGYDLFKESGDIYENRRALIIKGDSVLLSREDIIRAIRRVLDTDGNCDQKCDIRIVQKLSPYIMELKADLSETFLRSINFFK
ncbi:MAG: hypothetical protein IKP11_03300 [Paludibacteraceae bacterium]|nr:hypothetical protein [Paludibacteraceae bacterium]